MYFYILFMFILDIAVQLIVIVFNRRSQTRLWNQDCFVFFQTHSLAEDDHRLAYVSTPADVKPSVSQLMLELIQSRWA